MSQGIESEYMAVRLTGWRSNDEALQRRERLVRELSARADSTATATRPHGLRSRIGGAVARVAQFFATPRATAGEV